VTAQIISVVGMTGSGKSELAAILSGAGYRRIRFGDVTEDEVKRRGLPLNEANERQAREALRQDHGPAAYAKLNQPRIDAALKEGKVVIDGLYSWEEYLVLKDRYGEAFVVVAVFASPATRRQRLAGRAVRPLNVAETESRDHAEIENLNKGGPIAVADYTIVNESSPEALKQAAENLIGVLNNHG
jgi:dephospho-CoA kinase